MPYGYGRRRVSNPYITAMRRQQRMYRQPRPRYVVTNYNGTAWACRRGGTHWTNLFVQADQFHSQEEAMEAVRVLLGSQIVAIPPSMWKKR